MHDYGLPEKLHPIGTNTAWFRKRKVVTLDPTKYRKFTRPDLSAHTPVTFPNDPLHPPCDGQQADLLECLGLPPLPKQWWPSSVSSS